MKLREAEKAVLEAAERWVKDNPPTLECVGIHEAVTRYIAVKSAGKPKVKCYCGRTVSVEGDRLRYHDRADDVMGHAPTLDELEAHGGEVKDAAW